MTRSTCPSSHRTRLGVLVLGLATVTATGHASAASAAPFVVPASITAGAVGTSGSADAAEQEVAGLLSAAAARSTAGTSGTAAVVVGNTLPSGATLAPGDSLRSPSGRYELLMDPSGELLLQTTPNAYNDQPYVITALATGPAGSRLVLQTDGNLVLYGADDVATFDTMTRNGQGLFMQDDGNVVLYGDGGAVAFDFQTQEPDALFQGGTLLPGERLTSGDLGTSLVMQTDGNLVLYTGGAVRFATYTFVPGSALVFQEDGNVVVYSPELQPLFSTGTAGVQGLPLLAVLDRQFSVFELAGAGDDLVAIYGSAWGSGTVESGTLLLPGDRRAALGGRIVLVLQEDGNLVQYVDGRPAFRSRTTTADLALMQGDGNFVLYRATASGDLVPVFQTRSNGFPGSRLVVQDDRNIVVYTPADRAVYSTGR